VRRIKLPQLGTLTLTSLSRESMARREGPKQFVQNNQSIPCMYHLCEEIGTFGKAQVRWGSLVLSWSLPPNPDNSKVTWQILGNSQIILGMAYFKNPPHTDLCHRIRPTPGLGRPPLLLLPLFPPIVT